MMAAGITIGIVTAVVMALWALPMVASWMIDEVLNAGKEK